MKCYYHPEKDAVAICKECGKPLCENCAHEFNGKIYCEEDLIKVQEKSKKVDEKTERKEERAKRREERHEEKAQRHEKRYKRDESMKNYFPQFTHYISYCCNRSDRNGHCFCSARKEIYYSS